MASLIKIACVAVVCMAMVGAPMIQAQISCSQLASALEPCMGYLQNGGSVSQACCSSVQQLASGATTTADRQDVCNCLKTAASSYSGINPQYAESLPRACGLSNYPAVSASTNCSAIN